MKRFVEGEDRKQGVLLPEYLDDYVAENVKTRGIVIPGGGSRKHLIQRHFSGLERGHDRRRS
jgi:hypothetical protein